MKKSLLFVLLIGSSLQFVFAQEYLNDMYANDTKAIEQVLQEKKVDLNRLMVLYLENASILDVNMLNFLLGNGATLDNVIKDIRHPKTTYQVNEVLPTPALIRVLQEGSFSFIEALASYAEEQNIAYNFYFGSYSNNSLGSNGLLGAAFSKDYQAPASVIRYIWIKASKYYKPKTLAVARIDQAFVLTEDVESVKKSIESGENIESYWKSAIDFNSLKVLKFLCEIKDKPQQNSEQLKSMLDYAKAANNQDAIALIINYIQ